MKPFEPIASRLPRSFRALPGARAAACGALLVAFAAPGCGPAFDPAHPPRPALAETWFKRAEKSYRAGDFDDATESVKSAIQAAPHDPGIRALGARIALTRLDFPEVIRLTEGLQTSEVLALRGRAHWYAGDIEQAADELEAMLADPNVKDPWARDVSKLARRGIGRHPFALEGGIVASVEMPKAGPFAIVPCELEGESILALISTTSGELRVDSASRREPAWVNLSFGERDKLEVKDVPALVEDLSGLSRQLGLPVKALLGVNLLRHMHVTFDRHGDQFVVRRSEPTPPPSASRVPLWYARGGGTMMHIGLSSHEEDRAIMLVDTTAFFPLSLGDAQWRMAGVDPQALEPVPGATNLRGGIIPQLKFGAFDLPKIPAVKDVPRPDQDFGVDVGGVMGAGIFSVFRVTLADEGRFMWVEPDPTMLQSFNDEPAPRHPTPANAAPQPASPPGGAPPPAPPGATAPQSAPPAATPTAGSSSRKAHKSQAGKSPGFRGLTAARKPLIPQPDTADAITTSFPLKRDPTAGVGHFKTKAALVGCDMGKRCAELRFGHGDFP